MRRIGLSALILLFLVTAARGEDLRIVHLSLAPYSYEEDGHIMGVIHDLGDALAEEAGLTPKGRLVRLVRAVEELSMGRADVVLMLPTKEIEQVAENLGPIFALETVAMGRKGMDYGSVEQLRGLTVTAIRGARYDARISAENGIAVLPAKSYRHGLRMVLNNRVDAMVGPRVGLLYTIKEEGLPLESFGKPLFLSEAEVCVFLCRRAHSGLAEKLRSALARLKAKGAVKPIVDRYAPQ